MGSTDHPCSAGGEGTAHSNVSPPQGLLPAGRPRNQLCSTFNTNTPMPGTMMYTPMVEIMFHRSQPWPLG